MFYLWVAPVLAATCSLNRSLFVTKLMSAVDDILRLHFSTLFLNCIYELHFWTAFFNCIFRLHFSTAFFDCTFQLHFSTAFTLNAVYLCSVAGSFRTCRSVVLCGRGDSCPTGRSTTPAAASRSDGGAPGSQADGRGSSARPSRPVAWPGLRRGYSSTAEDREQ